MTTPITWQHDIRSDTYEVSLSDSEPKALRQELDHFWSDYVAVLGERLKRERLMYLTLVIDSVTGVMTVFAETRMRPQGTAQLRVYVFFPWLARARKALFDDFFDREEAGLENSRDDERKLNEMDISSLEEHAQTILATARGSCLASISEDEHLLVRLFFGNGEGAPVQEVDLS